jgi:hypothetical protein
MAISAAELEEERQHQLRVQQSLRVIQERADDAFAPWDFRAPTPVLGCDPDEYRRSLLIKAKKLLPGDNRLRHVEVRKLPSNALERFEDMIYPAAKATAYDRDSVADGETRRVVQTDTNGMKIINWVGNRSFIHDFARPGHRARIRTPDTHPGWFVK